VAEGGPTDFLRGDGLERDQRAYNLLEVLIDRELSGAGFTEVADVRRTDNRIMSTITGTILPCVFR
jgi:hypothetical protein